MLSVEQLKIIMLEVVHKKPLSIDTPEGRATRKEFEQELKDARKRGQILEFPYDGLDM